MNTFKVLRRKKEIESRKNGETWRDKDRRASLQDSIENICISTSISFKVY